MSRCHIAIATVCATVALTQLRLHVGLLGSKHEAFHKAALELDFPGPLFCDGVDGQHHISSVHSPDRDAGVAGHGCMDGLLCQPSAVGLVVGVGRHGTDHVGRVDVLDRDREVVLFAVARDLVLQVGAHVGHDLVPARVPLSGALDNGVAAPLRHDNHRPLLLPHQLRYVVEKLVQRGVHLRDEAYIYIPRSQRGRCGDPSAMPAHELDEADAVRIGGRLHVSG
mmetsp:Transcript_86647/g.185657  ORF Transcript_86647/g.185657 Transcript_86647/m.185657 type:complete len:224 (-) Transcript_86647:2338-3009(-)